MRLGHLPGSRCSQPTAGCPPAPCYAIVGSTFTGTVLDRVDIDGCPAVIPQVTGMAYRTREHVFSIDPYDPLVPRFLLR